MDLFEKVSEDIKNAMKAKDKVALDTLRNVKKVFLEAKTAPGANDTLTDADALANEGKFTQAIEAYKQAILADPNNVNTYISLARAEIFNQKYEDAKNDAANALLLNNNNATAHATLGWANIFLED